MTESSTEGSLRLLLGKGKNTHIYTVLNSGHGIMHHTKQVVLPYRIAWVNILGKDSTLDGKQLWHSDIQTDDSSVNWRKNTHAQSFLKKIMLFQASCWMGDRCTEQQERSWDFPGFNGIFRELYKKSSSGVKMICQLSTTLKLYKLRECVCVSVDLRTAYHMLRLDWKTELALYRIHATQK